jgi:HlyD family secretion protein
MKRNAMQKMFLASLIKIKIRFILAGTFIILTFVLNACSGQSGADQTTTQVIPAVEAVQSRTGSLPLTQRLSGVVEAKNQIEIYPEVSAVIEEVFVQNGDYVKKGKPLVRLRDKEFLERMKQAKAGYQIALAQLKQAEAVLKERESEIKRNETLAKQGLISPTELEMAQTRYVSSEADVALANARVDQAHSTLEERNENLAQTTVRAPISGNVGNRNAEIGMLVTGSTRLFTLGQLDEVRVNVILTDRMLTYIEEGQTVELIDENAPGGIMSAKLSRISPFLNPVSHSTQAEIDLKNPDATLKPGMFVTVDIFYGESEEATLVPLSALYENPTSGAIGVFVTDATFDDASLVSTPGGQSIELSDPVDFRFKQVDVIAKGRMEAGIGGIPDGKWVVSIGQNLMGGDEGRARVRPVRWARVERLQNLQREDLMEDLVKRQQKTNIDSILINQNDRPAD